MKGRLFAVNPEQKICRCNDIDFVPVMFKDIVKGDRLKLDVTENSVYIVLSEHYTDGIDVEKKEQ